MKVSISLPFTTVSVLVLKYLHHLNEALFLSVMWRFTSLVEDRSNSHRKGLKEVHLELDKNIKGYSAKRSLLSACGVYSSVVLILLTHCTNGATVVSQSGWNQLGVQNQYIIL